MPNRQPPRVPQYAQSNKGWEKRIPLTYGERFQHLSWMPEYEEFCRIVERSRRGAADRKYETLVQRSAKSVARNLSRISPEAIASLPDHVLGVVVEEVMADPKLLMTLKDDLWDAFRLPVLQEMWDRLYESQQLNLHLWKALSSRLRAAKSEHGKELRLYRFARVITASEDSENWDFTIYTQPLISPTFDFISSLSIGTALPMMDYIRLSSIVNLGTLEISDKLGYLPKAEKGPPRIDLDRLFRAWASRAEGGTAFQVLRSLRVDFKEISLTKDILPHLNKFPALGIVYPGPIKWSNEKGKMANGSKYVSDYDLSSIRPLLPQGWTGVTIRGPANGMRRDIHDSMKYSSAVDYGKGLSKEDYQGITGKERVRREKIGHEITTTRFYGRLQDRHCLHEVLDFSMMHRLPFALRSVLVGPWTSRCATPDSPALWHGNFLVDLPYDISTHEDLGEVYADFAANSKEDSRDVVVDWANNHELTYADLFHMPLMPFRSYYTCNDGWERRLRHNSLMKNGEAFESGPRNKSHSEDAWNGRYVAPCHSAECSPGVLTDEVKHAKKPSLRLPPLQQPRTRLEQKSTYDPAQGKYRGSISTYQATRPTPTTQAGEVKYSDETVSATEEGETRDFIKSTASSSSGESDIYYASTCPLHPTGVYHTSPPNPHIQCYNCTRNYPASTGSRASWNSALDDHETLRVINDDTAISENQLTAMQRLWNHENERPSLNPTFWNQEDDDSHPSYAHPTANAGLKAAERRLHAQDVFQGKPTEIKMDNNPAKREFSEEVYEQHYGWPMPKPLENVPKTNGSQIRKRFAFHGGDSNYDNSTERVGVMEFGMLGRIRLDGDLKKVGMDAGLAMLLFEGDGLEGGGQRMLEVESKVPIVTLRIGESVKWRSEGETVLLREDLPTEEEKGRAKKRREEGKEELKAWVRPPRREKKERAAKVEAKLMHRREEIRLHQAKKAEEKVEKEARGFDKNFWELVGLPPPPAGQGP